MAGSEKPDGLTPSLSKLMRVIADFLSPLFQDSQRYDRASESIFRTLTRHMVAHDEPIAEVENTQDEDQQASVVSAFLALASLRESFSQCEYYFRRFPFSGLPVSHADHLRNVCEMYFDRIEQFRARLKILLNALKAYDGKPDNRYGELIREFGKFFAWENKQRNLAHHRRRFEYDAIDQLGLIELLGQAHALSQSGELADLLPSKSMIYRQESQKWVKRVRQHGKSLEHVVEIAAELVLEKCKFLQTSKN